MRRNQKGQGMIEAVMVIPLAVLFLIYVVQVMLYLTVELAVDDTIENFLLCEVQSKLTCKMQFERELANLPLSETRFQFKQQGTTYKIDLSAQALRIFKLQKMRAITYDTQI